MKLQKSLNEFNYGDKFNTESYYITAYKSLNLIYCVETWTNTFEDPLEIKSFDLYTKKDDILKLLDEKDKERFLNFEFRF